jgi:dTMP kinase
MTDTVLEYSDCDSGGNNGRRSLFIVFEGIDGSGKTTQAELLQKFLLDRGEQAILSPEPSAGIIGSSIREFALHKKHFFTTDKSRFDEQMAYLFAADRYYHLYNDVDGVFKLIADGCHVLTTRYYFSSIAYNSETPAQEELVRRLNRDFPNPDVVIYLDIPVKRGLARLDDRTIKEVYETETKLTEVKANYEKIFSTYQGRLLKIDALKSIEEIEREIINFLDSI